MNHLLLKRSNYLTALSITTDYQLDFGDPEPFLRAIAEAGFTHIHWCHQWNTDFVYHAAEIDQIQRWLTAYGLQLADIHGSEGKEKFWYSPLEYARLAGVELVKNRIDFAAQLGADAVVMHLYPPTQDPALAPFNPLIWEQVRKSLDALQPYALARGVRIALENLIDFRGVSAGAVTRAAAADNFALIEQLYAHYPPEYLGFCYDSGHAILGHNRMGRLAPLMRRLAVLHLHDNDGEADLHRLLFDGVVDWGFAAALIAESPYAKPMSYEVSMRNAGIADAAQFLAQAHTTGARFAAMVAAQRG
ncbi:MAG: sugar phosphate isomerase/epimerase [Caldilineaceae bacterium]|nr:sugar phosphate isomerase/epimerase [Caldilineaceae bacterium]